MDENLTPVFRTELLRLMPEMEIRQIGQANAPSTGTLDPEILIWCEASDFLLVTNNRRSMPVHLAAHLTASGHIPGILTLDLSQPYGVLLQELYDIVTLSFEDEYRDRIEYVPLAR